MLFKPFGKGLSHGVNGTKKKRRVALSPTFNENLSANCLGGTKMGYPKPIGDITELRILISEGNKLKDLPESNTVFGVSDCSGLAVPVVSRMDSWMEDGIKRIYTLLPKTIIDADFSDIARIHDACSGPKQIITFGRKERINTILNVLQCCLKFTVWVAEFNETMLSPKQRAEFYFGPLRAMVLYIHKELVLLLIGLEDGRTRKTALLHLYGRIFQSNHGVVKLNDIKCCQLLTASLRGLLEIYVDMLLLNKGLIDNGAEKFFSFDEIYKLRSAKKLVKIDEEIKSPKKESSVLIEYIRDEERITQKAKTLWGKQPKDITHWSNLNLESRSCKAGELKMFRDIYYYGNMFVHSGYVDFSKTEDDAHLLCSYVYAFSSEILKKSTDIICSEINIARKEEIGQEITGICYLFGYFQLWKSLVQNQNV